MNIHQLSFLLQIVECGSFSKAEETLFLSKQALKKQIDSLEDELGFAVVKRGRQGISLTPAGEEFCKDTEKILQDIEAITLKCRGIAFNEQIIRIENPYHPRLLLEKAFDEFSRNFPTVRQHIILQSTNMLVDDILNNRADLAECTYHKKFEVPGIACTKLFPTPYKCLVNSTHSLASRDIIRPQDLIGQRVYIVINNFFTPKLTAELLEKAPSISFEYLPKNDTKDIINICYNGGVFISKTHFINYLDPLVTVPLETSIVAYAAVMHKENPSQLVKEFIKVAQGLYVNKKDVFPLSAL